MKTVTLGSLTARVFATTENKITANQVHFTKALATLFTRMPLCVQAKQYGDSPFQVKVMPIFVISTFTRKS